MQQKLHKIVEQKILLAKSKLSTVGNWNIAEQEKIA